MDQSHDQRTQRYAQPQHAQISGDSPLTRTNHNFFDEDEEYDDVWPTRMPTSVRRYRSDVRFETGRVQPDVQSYSSGENVSFSTLTGQRSAIPARRTATQTNIPAVSRRQALQPVPANASTIIQSIDTEEVCPRRSSGLLLHHSMNSGRRWHWMVYVGLAMFVMLAGWILLSMLLNWWQVTQDDWHYGRPRTFQTDMAVGHNDSALNPSHFVAINLRRHVEVIEFPGGDATHAKVYIGPLLIGPGQDLAAVTLSFKDVNHDGKLDMIVSVQDSHFVFLNENGSFRPARPNENIQQ